MPWLHHVSLLVHLIGIALLGAAAIGGFLVDFEMWRAIESEPGRAAPLYRLALRLGACAQWASVAMLLSGLGMLASVNYAFWGAPWLTGKLVLFVLLGANGGAIIGGSLRRLGRLVPSLQSGAPGVAPATGPAPAAGAGSPLAALRARIALGHRAALAMFVLVLGLAVFRP